MNRQRDKVLGTKKSSDVHKTAKDLVIQKSEDFKAEGQDLLNKYQK